ncbi:MAG: Gfo/Idh/MocA family protein [Promethearchaeota archaeon]
MKQNNREKQITAILCGAGSRGREIYGKYALNHPKNIKFIAVADPNQERRETFQKEHNIPNNMAFNSWDELLTENVGKIADVAFICTQDRMHYKPAAQALNMNYHLLLEKPIASTLKECQNLDRLAKEKGKIVQVAHVLRYTEFFQNIKKLVDSGVIGEIIDYDQSENVSYWHFGHSYVRGPYNKREESSPIILAKTCHDLDILYWILGERPIEVQSQGELSFYKPDNAPSDAPERCTDGCPHAEDCPWYAPDLYVDALPLIRTGLHASSRFIRWMTKHAIKKDILIRFLALFRKDIASILNWTAWPATVLTDNPSREVRIEKLKTSPYGKCIFKAGNNVMDHQIAVFKFPHGITGTIRLTGLSDLEGREIRIFGTKGVIRGYFRNAGEQITITDFLKNETRIIYQKALNFDGHGGGDTGLMDAFIEILQGKIKPEEAGTTNIHGALESHYMGFAADIARLSGETIEIKDFRQIKSRK